MRRGFQLTVARWRILRFPLSESTLNFRIFFSSLFRPSCEVFHVVVSTEAHYRDPNFLHKYFFDLFFCLLFFHPFCCNRTQNGAFLHTKRLAQGQ
ncbi:hypothetical protein HMPREF9541_00150 [Escherichia coli MS 116-1]|nr:hypothetical protein HMPREF9541_00150 [Escherichia coli MS 116-1]